MTKTYEFKNRHQYLGGNIPDDAIVISADDTPVFMTRLTRITKTMDYLFGEYQYQKHAGVTIEGVAAGDLYFLNGLAHEVDIYHVSGERVGSFSWLSTDLEYFVGVAVELGDEYLEGKFIVDAANPVDLYTKSIQVVDRYPVEELFGEFMEFVEDYGLTPVLK